MTSWHVDAVLAAAGFGAGMLNAVAGGGTFLTLPALIWAGIPPVAANATSAVAVFPGYLGGAWGFRRELATVGRSLLLRMTLVSLLGGLLGAALLLVTSNEAFTRIVPWLLLFATVLFAVGARRRDVTAPVSARVLAWRLPALGIVAAYGGYFNGGLGILLMAALSMAQVGGLNTVNGLKSYLSALLAAVSLGLFASAGLIHWREALLMMVFSTLGGYTGARVARVLPARWIYVGVICVGLATSAVFLRRLT